MKAYCFKCQKETEHKSHGRFSASWFYLIVCLVCGHHELF